MTIQVFENPNKSLTISWDETDPVESQLNTWTEEDFVRAIIEEAEKYAERDQG
jgi:hypothetical protein